MEPWLRNSKYLGSEIWEDNRKIYYVNANGNNKTVGGYWRSDPLYLVTLLTLPKSGHSALRSSIPIIKQALTDFASSQKRLRCHSDILDSCETR
jgi:hypothetical protein